MRKVCEQAKTFLNENQAVLDEMIRDSDALGKEMGFLIEMDKAGQMSFGKKCVGRKCWIEMKSLTPGKRLVGQFHTHPDHGTPYNPIDIYPEETFSLGDIFNALATQCTVLCVGRTFADDTGDKEQDKPRPVTTCSCMARVIDDDRLASVILRMVTEKEWFGVPGI